MAPSREKKNQRLGHPSANQKGNKNSDSMLNLYTIILEFDGGTYVVQCEGESPSAAIINWQPADDENEQCHSLRPIRDQVADQLRKGDNPVAVMHSSNTWCLSGTLDGK